MTITVQQLRAIMPYCPLARAQEKVDPINEAMVAFGIDQSNVRIADYLAEVAVETGELRYKREIGSGAAYEGRTDLGNIYPGDGMRFPGRGDLQNTGRGNYLACSIALYGDERLIQMPELLEEPGPGSMSGGWFWQSHGLSILSDSDQFLTISVRINGRGPDGLPNGWAARQSYRRRCRQVLQVAQ